MQESIYWSDVGLSQRRAVLPDFGLRLHTVALLGYLAQFIDYPLHLGRKGPFHEPAIVDAEQAFNSARTRIAAVKPMIRIVMLGEISDSNQYVRTAPCIGADFFVITRTLLPEFAHAAQNGHSTLFWPSSLG